MSTTIYDVGLRYRLDDRSSRTMVGMGEKADALWTKISRVGSMLAGGFVVGKAKSAFVDFNSDLENMRGGMQASIALNRASTMTFEQAGVAADGLVDKFQELAKVSPATTKDFVGFADLITGPLLRAGGTIEDIKRATYGGILGANVFHIDAEAASRDIESVLGGTLSAKDRFARAMLEPMGYTTAAVNAMDPKKRLQVLLSAMENPALLKAGEKMAGTWSGQWSTIVDNFEMGLGKVGLPLFKQITAEVKRWNEWMGKNQSTVEAIGQKAGKYLVDGFHALKDGISFIIDHKDTLLRIAEGYLALKAIDSFKGMGGGGGVGGAVAGVAGRVGMAGALGMAGYQAGSSGPTGSTALGVGMGALGAAAMLPGPQQPFIAGAAATLYVGKLIADYVEEKHVVRAKAQADVVNVIDAAGLNRNEKRGPAYNWDRHETDMRNVSRAYSDTGTMPAYSETVRADIEPAMSAMRAQGLIGEDGQFAWKAYLERTKEADFLGWDEKRIKDFGDKFALIAGVASMIDGALAKPGAAGEKKPGEGGWTKKGEKPNKKDGATNISIARVEVASDDPDRFAMQLVKLGRKHTRNRSVARDAPAGGG